MLKKYVADINTVEEKFRVLYEKQEDGTYRLIDGISEDVSGLKANANKLKQEKLDLKAKLEEYEARERARKEKELLEEKKFEDLLKAKTEAYTQELDKAAAQVAKMTEYVKKSASDAAVSKLAAELAGENAPLIQPHIAARIKVELDEEGTPQVQYLGQEGSMINQDALLEEFRGNPVFKTVLKGRNSSGGGSGGGADGGDAADEAAQEAWFNPDSPHYSPTKQWELQQKNPRLHDKFLAKYIDV